MDNKLQVFNFYFSKYKKPIILISIGSGVIYYLYRRFLSDKVNTLKEIYLKMSEYNEAVNSTANYENISKQYENSFGNLLNRLLEVIRQKIENQFSLCKCFTALPTTPKEELHRMWILFKNKSFVSLYTGIFITRCLMILSQTHLLILEKLTAENNMQKTFYADLLNDLWLLAVDFIEYLTKTLENKLTPLAEEIAINRPVSRDKFIEFFRSMRRKIEEITIEVNDGNCEVHLNIFEKYLEELLKKINMMRKNNFTNDLNSLKTDSFLKFYETYYDIITSNVFHVIIVKGLDYDFSIVEDSIDLNFENEKKSNINLTEISIPKIASFVYKMYKQMMDSDHTIFLINNYKNNKFPEDLNEYFKLVYDI